MRRGERERGERDIERESERERHREREWKEEDREEEKISPLKDRVKSSGNLPTGEIKRKERLITKIIRRNYQEKLSAEIITGNYQEKLWREIIS